MDTYRRPSPPLPPDPTPHFQARAQPIQEPTAIPLPPPSNSAADPAHPLYTHAESAQAPLTRPPAPQRGASVLQQPQPIQDAVHDAFDNAPKTNDLDPVFIQQVVEQVVKNLQVVGATPSSATQLHPFSSAPSAPASNATQSPTQSSNDSFPQRYTPPTPERTRDARGHGDSGSSSPEPPPSDSGSSASNEGRRDAESDGSSRSRGTRRTMRSEATVQPTRPVLDSRRRTISTDKARTASMAPPREHDLPVRRDSKASDSSYDGVPRTRIRPPRVPSDVEETTLEKIWRPLFENGHPTMRLSQFLRGIAVHLIEHYEPRSSLVVTPAKMHRFFHETKVNEEHYPWDTIFGGKLTPASISLMYRRLLCQHHLVQNQHFEQPSVPGLTPAGFDYFMTCLIQAHPSTEFERLAKALREMPISNADDKTERFPKELTRRLLPAERNIQAEQRIVSSLNHEPYVIANLRGTLSMPPPPSSAPPIQPGAIPERDRQPYYQSPQHSNAVDDDDLTHSAVPIERERKPYTAKEGTGKFYDPEDGRSPPRNQYSKSDNPPPSSIARPNRTNSTAPPPSSFGGSNSTSDPMTIPSRPAPRISTANPINSPVVGSNINNGNLPKVNSRRDRSPPLARYPNARSDPYDVGAVPTSQYGGSSAFPVTTRESRPQNYDDEQQASSFRRYASRPRPNDRDRERERERERERSSTTSSGNAANNITMDDDSNSNASSRGYPMPIPVTSRNVPAYEYGASFGSGSLPPDRVNNRPPPPPQQQQQQQQRPGYFGDDQRRKSMYGAGSDFARGNNGGGGEGGGGSDGYGSFAGGGGAQAGYGAERY